MNAKVTFALFLAAALAASAATGWAVSGRIESGTRAQAMQALAASGAQWAQAEVDGLIVTVSGEAPDDDQKTLVLAAIAAISADARIVDRLTVAAAPERFHPETDFRIMRGVGHLTVTGALPGEAARDALAAALRAALPDMSLTDLTRTDAVSTAVITRSADHLARITASLLHGTIIVNDGSITVSGIASGREQQMEIERSLGTLAGAGWRTDLVLADPPSRVAELAFHAETGPDGRGVMTCLAASEADAAAIAARAATLFGTAPDCTVSPAEDGAQWGEAVLAALDALAAIPAGDVRLTGWRVRLSGAAPTRKRELDAASAQLKAALPQRYTLMLLTPPPVAEIASAQQVSSTFRIDYDGVTIRLSGEAPSEILARTLSSYARAQLSGVSVEADMNLRPEIAADDWRSLSMLLVSAIARLEAGFAEFDAERILLDGIIEQPGDIPDVHRMIAQSSDSHRRVTTHLKVAMADRAAAQPLPPARCAEALTEITAADPILFAPGSAKIEESSRAVITRLVETMSSCSDGKVEIGGHTDSEGSEQSNLFLSRDRAEAVLEALLQDGVRATKLAAKGYGEAEPIADNATDAGRRANRRIAFRVVPDEESER